MPVAPQSAPGPHCTLDLKVIPNAPRDEIAGWLGDALKVKIHAPPSMAVPMPRSRISSPASSAFPRRAVALVRGGQSRHKLVRIDGLTLDAIRRRLGGSMQ